MSQYLYIESKVVKLDSTFSLRWVEKEDGSSYPVLYKNGKRVVKNWSLFINFSQPADEFGGNANTD